MKKSRKISSQNKRFNKILEDIRSIKIQGAENVARAGIKAFLIEPSKGSAKRILKTRPTEPLMQNAIKALIKSKNPKKDSIKFLKELKKSHETIAKKGSTLIKKDMNIFTHCHSSTVIDILKYAKRKQKKKFIVYTTEAEPILQGRMTAEDLSKAKIKVIISPDLAAERALKNCDLLLFGADAFTKKEVANKIGTNTLVNLAKLHNIPRYACGVSKKFTKKIKIKLRNPKEVWTIKNKNIKIENPPFDKTPIKSLTGIISEFGILTPKKFVKKANQ
jgi:translation initiation factor 2B subunit (eIF-2B alpha/beta/delta family)|tara:strand:+ start:93 stop:920 length:828 start_codon:yes stop_codon:yes gene_type:complete